MKTLSLIGLVLSGFLMSAFAKAAVTIPDTYFYCYPNYYGYSLPRDTMSSDADEQDDQYLADNSAATSDFPYSAYPSYYPNYQLDLSYPAYSYASPDYSYYPDNGYSPYSYGYYPADTNFDDSYSHFWPYFGYSPWWGGYCPGLYTPNFIWFFNNNDNIFRHHDRDFRHDRHHDGHDNHDGDRGRGRFADHSGRDRGFDSGRRDFTDRSGSRGGEVRSGFGNRNLTSPRFDASRGGSVPRLNRSNLGIRGSNPRSPVLGNPRSGGNVRNPVLGNPRSGGNVRNPVLGNPRLGGSPRNPVLGNQRPIQGGSPRMMPRGGSSIRSFGGSRGFTAPSRSFGGSAIRSGGGGRSFGGGGAVHGGGRSFGGGGGRSFGGGGGARGGGGGHGGGGHR